MYHVFHEMSIRTGLSLRVPGLRQCKMGGVLMELHLGGESGR